MLYPTYINSRKGKNPLSPREDSTLGPCIEDIAIDEPSLKRRRRQSQFEKEAREMYEAYHIPHSKQTTATR